MNAGFSKARFVRADDRAALMKDLEDELTRRLRDAGDLHLVTQEIIQELRALGHDLWSFDASDDFEIWAPDYQTPKGPGLILTLSREGAYVEWSSR